MLLLLKAGDGDLLLITEPALLTRCAWQLHSINRAAQHDRSLYKRLSSDGGAERDHPFLFTSFNVK